MLQQPQPDDFVLATGIPHSVQQLLEIAFSYVGLDWKKYVEIDPALVRPTETKLLYGDASKARKILGWKPKVNFKKLIEMMVDSDLALLSQTIAMPIAAAAAGD